MIHYFKTELKDSEYLRIEEEERVLKRENVESAGYFVANIGASLLIVPNLEMATHLSQQAVHNIIKNYLLVACVDDDIGRCFFVSMSMRNDHNYEVLVEAHMISQEIYAKDCEERKDYDAEFEELITTLRGE